MITVAEFDDLLLGSAAVICAGLWCVYALRKIQPAVVEALAGRLHQLSTLAAGNVLVYWLLSVFSRPHGPLWDSSLIDNPATLWHALVDVAHDVTAGVVLVLAGLSVLALIFGVDAWLSAPVGGRWGSITNGTRARRWLWSWWYEKRLVRQVKAYARVQGGRSRTITVERVFEADEASTALRIKPLLNLPLAVDNQRPFTVLALSEGFQHNVMLAMTVLEVRWDLAAIDRGPRRRPLTGRRALRLGIGGALTALAAVLVASTLVSSGSSPDAGVAGRPRLVTAADAVPDGGQLLPAGPGPAWVVNDTDLRLPTHRDGCVRSERAAINRGCEAVTWFTADRPITVTQVGLDPYGVLAHRRVRQVVWEFDDNPATQVVQTVEPHAVWQILRLRTPLTASTVSVKVTDAVDTDQVAVATGNGFRLIGHDAQFDLRCPDHGCPTAGSTR